MPVCWIGLGTCSLKTDLTGRATWPPGQNRAAERYDSSKTYGGHGADHGGFDSLNIIQITLPAASGG